MARKINPAAAAASAEADRLTESARHSGNAAMHHGAMRAHERAATLHADTGNSVGMSTHLARAAEHRNEHAELSGGGGRTAHAPATHSPAQRAEHEFAHHMSQARSAEAAGRHEEATRHAANAMNVAANATHTIGDRGSQLMHSEARQFHDANHIGKQREALEVTKDTRDWAHRNLGRTSPTDRIRYADAMHQFNTANAKHQEQLTKVANMTGVHPGPTHTSHVGASRAGAKPAAQRALQQGKKGGAFYLTPNGTKIYVKGTGHK